MYIPVQLHYITVLLIAVVSSHELPGSPALNNYQHNASKLSGFSIYGCTRPADTFTKSHRFHTRSLPSRCLITSTTAKRNVGNGARMMPLSRSASSLSPLSQTMSEGERGAFPHD